jgi:hypothetical protein
MPVLLPCLVQVKFDSAMAPLCSAYYRGNCEPPLTTKTASFAGTLDYIWVSRQPPCTPSATAAFYGRHCLGSWHNLKHLDIYNMLELTKKGPGQGDGDCDVSS